MERFCVSYLSWLNHAVVFFYCEDTFRFTATQLLFSAGNKFSIKDWKSYFITINNKAMRYTCFNYLKQYTNMLIICKCTILCQMSSDIPKKTSIGDEFFPCVLEYVFYT